jgi:hypothetical protein
MLFAETVPNRSILYLNFEVNSFSVIFRATWAAKRAVVDESSPACRGNPGGADFASYGAADERFRRVN